MRPPKRLVEDPAAPAGLRADLTHFQRVTAAYDPTAQLSALRAALKAADSAGAASPGGAGPSVQSASGLTGSAITHGSGWALKGALVALLGGAGLGVVGLRGTSTPAASQPRTSAAQVAASTRAASTPTEAIAAEVTQVAEGNAAGTHNAGAPRVLEPAAFARTEVALLVQARRQLDGQPAQALQTLRGMGRAFPRGALSEEREALAVLALAKLGQQSAAARAARAFLEAHPESPLRTRLEAILAP
ncbi:MAG: hypothetical protein RL385_569 [Pseudomonadota bacterium]|jgi:hypothetical protein